MTNKLAIGLAIVIAGVFAVDAMAYDGTLPLFVGKKLYDLLDWLAFWR